MILFNQIHHHSYFTCFFSHGCHFCHCFCFQYSWISRDFIILCPLPYICKSFSVEATIYAVNKFACDSAMPQGWFHYGPHPWTTDDTAIESAFVTLAGHCITFAFAPAVTFESISWGIKELFLSLSLVCPGLYCTVIHSCLKSGRW